MMLNSVFQLKSSRYAAKLVWTLYFSWLAGIFSLHLPAVLWFGLAVSGAIYSGYHIKNLSRMDLIEIQNQSILIQKSKNELQIFNCISAFVSSWVLVLYLQDSFSGEKKTQVVFCDALSKWDYQCLLLKLKYRVFL